MIMKLLLLLVPVSLVLEYLVHAPPLWVFGVSVLAIVPLADLLRRATEQISARTGPAIGGLLNVTFGNLAELIIAIFVLLSGSAAVVKAQITGSIIGNGLLGLGVAFVAGTIFRRRPAGAGEESDQKFNRANAGQLNSMLFLTVVALLLPAFFDLTERLPGFTAGSAARRGDLDEYLSLGAAALLIVVYLLNLVYTLVTHKDVFASDEQGGHQGAPWPLWRALAVLVGATAVIALESELLSGALEGSSAALGLTPFFLGIVVLAVVGNFSEYLSAGYFARQGQIGLAINIVLGGTIQVALFTAPLLVLLSWLLGRPMNLVFSSPLELVAIVAVALIVTTVTKDGEASWFEGVLVLAVYLLLALAFFFVTPSEAGARITPDPLAPSPLGRPAPHSHSVQVAALSPAGPAAPS